MVGKALKSASLLIELLKGAGLILIFSLLMVFILGCALGANGVFKSVAILIGSDLMPQPVARILSIGFAIIGGTMSLLLLPHFFMPPLNLDFLADNSNSIMICAIVFATFIVMILGNRFGFPLSSTVTILGAAFGAELASNSTTVKLELLASNSLIWIAATPLVAWLLASTFHWLGDKMGQTLGIDRKTKISVNNAAVAAVPQGENPLMAVTLMQSVVAENYPQGTNVQISETYEGAIGSISINNMLCTFQIVIAALLACVWGLLEVQKVLLLASFISPSSAVLYGVAGLAGLVVGASFFGDRVGKFMSHSISELKLGSGLIASFSAFLCAVLSAIMVIPGSLTYGVGGAIMGVGMAKERLKIEHSVYMLAAWIVTWPVSMALGGLCYLAIKDLVK